MNKKDIEREESIETKEKLERVEKGERIVEILTFFHSISILSRESELERSEKEKTVSASLKKKIVQKKRKVKKS